MDRAQPGTGQALGVRPTPAARRPPPAYTHAMVHLRLCWGTDALRRRARLLPHLLRGRLPRSSGTRGDPVAGPGSSTIGKGAEGMDS